MKILSITQGEYEEIITDDIEPLNTYRRLDQLEWCHWLGETHQWLTVRFCDELEDMYTNYMKDYGKGTPSNITNA